jgi:hypothetical protein
LPFCTTTGEFWCSENKDKYKNYFTVFIFYATETAGVTTLTVTGFGVVGAPSFIRIKSTRIVQNEARRVLLCMLLLYNFLDVMIPFFSA